MNSGSFPAKIRLYNLYLRLTYDQD